MNNPPITGNNELDAYLYNVHLNLQDQEGVPTIPVDPTSGDPVTYPYQYIAIKYADDNVGGGFSNTPTGKMYWGIYNSDTSTESTNPADYTWYKTIAGFGSATFVFFLCTGARTIKFYVDTYAPNYKWVQEPGTSIDLDSLVPAGTITYNELMNAAVTELKLADAAVTAAKTNIAALNQATGALNPSTVSAAQIINGAVTELKLLDGAVTNTKIYAGTITGDKIAANTIGANQIAANAITANKIEAGAVTATKILAGAVTASKIAAGTITADRIEANSIAVATQYTNAGSITAILAFATPITVANTNLISSFTVSNTSNVDCTLSAVGTGRSGATGNSTTDSQTLGVFNPSGTLVYDYGWSPAGEDAKTFSFTFFIAAGSSMTFQIRGAKTSAFSLTLAMKTVVVGVKN